MIGCFAGFATDGANAGFVRNTDSGSTVTRGGFSYEIEWTLSSLLPFFFEGVCGGVAGGVNKPLLQGVEAPELDPEHELGVSPEDVEESDEKESERV